MASILGQKLALHPHFHHQDNKFSHKFPIFWPKQWGLFLQGRVPWHPGPRPWIRPWCPWLPTNQDDVVEVKVDYHGENIVKIPLFLWKYPLFSKIHGDYLPKTPPFCWNPWTMPQAEKHPLCPCKCRLACAPHLDWTAVAGSFIQAHNSFLRVHILGLTHTWKC